MTSPVPTSNHQVEVLPDHACLACESRQLVEASAFPSLTRVTSDAKPFGSGGRLAQCEHCGMVQKLPDAAWRRDAAEIYANYEMFHQGNGADQKVRDPETNRLIGRCQLICQRLARSAQPDRILDVGCGSGVFLRACSQAFPTAKVSGFDLDDRAARALSEVPNFERLFTGELRKISGQFSLIALIHSLEHIPSPLDALSQIGQLLEPGGRLLVQVPDAAASPLDLVVADHLSHFDRYSLLRLLRKAGYEVLEGPQNWVGKELSAVAVFRGETDLGASEPEAGVRADLGRQMRWLQNFGECCKRVARDRPFGIFGSSIAAAWLAGQPGVEADFFLDEDENRVGRRFLGAPILTPAQRPLNSCVFIGLLPAVAGAIATRMDPQQGRTVEPPPFD